MARSLAHVALVVRDYDEAIAWFTGKLGFELVADECQAEQDKRWVLVAPSGAGGTSLLLARAATPDQQAFVGNQSGGRVFLFLRTDDFGRDFEAMRAKGIRFVRPPKQAAYGTVAVFEDLYGNLWDLVQFAPAAVGDAVPAEAPRSSRMVPQFRVGDMAAAVDFYTRILDFELPPGESVEDPVLSLVRGGV